MFNITLFEPEIPPNTGNIIRLCANTGSQLHLIHPLGFRLNDKQLLRAGLDYHEQTIIKNYKSFDEFIEQVEPDRVYAVETSGTRLYTQANFLPGDTLLFGSETHGLPDRVLNQLSERNLLRIPMFQNIRSLNLSNSVAVVVYEAWRQNIFLK